jgi:ESS family glutamate:Na+ symporter
MDFSALNTSLWNPIIQIGIIAGLILLANTLRQKIPFIRNSLMPTAVMAGFIMLILRSVGIIEISTNFLEGVTYHTIALGFIALSLRVPEKEQGEGVLLAGKNGALIVSTYLVQGIAGLITTILLAYTVMPNVFKASGLLLPMAYGQGPGQANNVGSTYEALGMAGGRSFGLSLAAMGYLCACIVGVIYLNILNKKGKVTRASGRESVSGSVTIDTFQDKNEIPISESIDRFSIQAALVCLVYLITYLLTFGITTLLEKFAPGLAKTLGTLLWGFNFIIGSLVATAARGFMGKMKKAKIMTRQYQNNYLLSRISGVAFDFMIVAGIASIDISDLSGNWIPFIIMSILGGVITFYYLYTVCKKLYPDYFYEGFLSMYGMLTGTISSGVLLLREIDPELKTQASNNLITGSSFGIAFGAPVLLIISYAPKNTLAVFISLGVLVVYLAALLTFIYKAKGKKQK